jgi:hypothetical protein
VLEHGGYVVGLRVSADKWSGSGGRWRVSVMVCLGFSNPPNYINCAVVCWPPTPHRSVRGFSATWRHRRRSFHCERPVLVRSATYAALIAPSAVAAERTVGHFGGMTEKGRMQPMVNGGDRPGGDGQCRRPSFQKAATRSQSLVARGEANRSINLPRRCIGKADPARCAR